MAINSPLDELRAAAKLQGPKMGPRPDAAANVALLRDSPMASNMTMREPAPVSPFTIDRDPAHNYSQRGGPSGVTMTGGSAASEPYWSTANSAQNRRGDDQFARGQAQSLAGLQQAFTESQRQGDVLQGRDDQDLWTGLTGQRMARQAGATAGARSILSEGAAGDTFLPNAARARERDMGDRLAETEARYVEPARMAAGATRDAAGIRAQGQIGAAQAHEGTAPLRALQQALGEWIAKTGELPTPEEMQQIQQHLGIAPPPQAGSRVPGR